MLGAVPWGVAYAVQLEPVTGGVLVPEAAFG